MVHIMPLDIIGAQKTLAVFFTLCFNSQDQASEKKHFKERDLFVLNMGMEHDGDSLVVGKVLVPEA